METFKSHLGVLLIAVIILGIGNAKALRSDVVQSSTYNTNGEELAIDADASTCSKTGYDVGPWWRMDLGDVQTVTGVTLSGNVDAFQVRVGNETEDVGLRRGFDNNPLCLFHTGVQTAGPGVFSSDALDCRRPRVGRYLSIHVVDPAKFSQIVLCDVAVQTMM